jgi:hypothetical protein
MLNLDKIRKNWKMQYLVISNTSLTLRRLGSSGVLPTNPQVARSSRAGRAMYPIRYMAGLNLTWFRTPKDVQSGK